MSLKPEAIDLTDVLERLERLETIREIEQLKYRYWRACDSKDVAAFRDCFVEHGADIDYGPVGSFDDREGLVEVFATQALAKTPEGNWINNDIHHGKHPAITLVDKETAVGRWTFLFIQIQRADQVVAQSAMEYDDRYVVENGEWKIQKSHVIPLSGMVFPVPAGAVIAPGPQVAGM